MPLSTDWFRKVREEAARSEVYGASPMKAPTQEQLNDPEWWDRNFAPRVSTIAVELDARGGLVEIHKCLSASSMIATSHPDNDLDIYQRPTKPAAPEWDGGGLPPVGCEIEIWFNDGRSGWWQRALVIAHDEEIAVVRVGNCYYGRSNYTSSLMRPIRTKEQRQKDDLAKTLKESTDRSIQWCEDVAAALIADGWCRWE